MKKLTICILYDCSISDIYRTPKDINYQTYANTWKYAAKYINFVLDSNYISLPGPRIMQLLKHKNNRTKLKKVLKGFISNVY